MTTSNDIELWYDYDLEEIPDKKIRKKIAQMRGELFELADLEREERGSSLSWSQGYDATMHMDGVVDVNLNNGYEGEAYEHETIEYYPWGEPRKKTTIKGARVKRD